MGSSFFQQRDRYRGILGGGGKMFNDCHCVVGLRRRYERVFLMGQVVSVHVERSCSEARVFRSEYCNGNPSI